MGWWIVMQPNGRFGRFSSIVDNFTVMNLDNGEMIDHLLRDVDITEFARNKARELVTDARLQSKRWSQSIATIVAIHSSDIATLYERLGSMTDEQLANKDDEKLYEKMYGIER